MNSLHSFALVLLNLLNVSLCDANDVDKEIGMTNKTIE